MNTEILGTTVLCKSLTYLCPFPSLKEKLMCLHQVASLVLTPSINEQLGFKKASKGRNALPQEGLD